MTSSLVVQTSFIGDVILTTPLIAKLAETGDVDVVTTPVGATVLANNPAIRRVIVYDKRDGDRGVAGLVGAGIRARRGVGGGRSVAEGYESGGAFASPSEKYVARATPTAPPATGDEVGLAGGVPGFDAKVEGRGWGEVWHNISQLGRSTATHERGRWDKLSPTPDRRAYLAQGSVRSAVLAIVAGCRERVGFDTSSGWGLYTRRVMYREDWHHARRLLSLAGETDGAMVRPQVYPGDGDVAAVDCVLGGRTRPFVALAPGSVWETKRWPYYGELALRLSEEFDVVVVGGSGDAAMMGEAIGRVDPERIIDVSGKLSLLGSAEVVRRAVVLVTNDSAPQHLASAVGTPTVTVFGPTVPEFGFGPLAARSRVVGRDGLACRPCDRHGPRRCPLGHWKCMREVTVEEVCRVVEDIVGVGR